MTMFEPYFRDYKLIFINCPSRGKSSDLDRDTHTLDDYAARIYDVLTQIVKEQQIKELSIVGYSMGGMLRHDYLSTIHYQSLILFIYIAQRKLLQMQVC